MTRYRKHPASPRSVCEPNGETVPNKVGFGTGRLLCFSLSGTRGEIFRGLLWRWEQGFGGRHEEEFVMWVCMNAGNLVEGSLHKGRGDSISCLPAASRVMCHTPAVCRRALARRPPRDPRAGVVPRTAFSLLPPAPGRTERRVTSI